MPHLQSQQFTKQLLVDLAYREEPTPRLLDSKAGIIVVYSSRDSAVVETEPNGDSSVHQLLTQL